MLINSLKAAIKPVKNDIDAYLKYYDNRMYQQWYFRYGKKIAKFKDIHKGESCFIIGNGPSLKNMDLSPLKNYHTFGLNKIYLMFDKVDLNLSYHVAVNRLVIEQSVSEFESLQCPSFLSYIPAHTSISPLDHIYYILTGGLCKFSSNPIEIICEGHTVTYVAMQIAFYMGFSKVFLIGVDHNFIAQGQPNEQQILQGEDPNHFAPNYFGNQQWHLPDLEASEIHYHIAKFNYNRANRQIYDATVNGKLQIFPKISYEEALNKCRFSV
ncbi:6-hydroxymethylpterin diphosphokinase MptE-like protein [Anabaena sp. FACHB-1237]|uniref:6-hydroxymethylpterin diphosphokinase MptE-like protein n=1 Tax=Anabaena sp. FACHB-1237 TaxID=2692769 RepID=UPI0018F03E27|nr:6-hydroxymethylpterin diphosphokinase MptE-like protein [Anabaena sp. FACHB-1237]